jgi:hypothetical protein
MEQSIMTMKVVVGICRKMALVSLIGLMYGHAEVAPVPADEMRWDDAEKEVGHTRIPQAFFDSVSAIHGVGDSRGLRLGNKLPFLVTEKLVFDGGWGFIRAGFAILSAGYSPDDTSRILLSGKVVTNNFVSSFYKVRDFVLSVNDSRGLYPLTFEQHVQEGRYRATRWTLFDQVNNRVYDQRRDSAYAVTPFAGDYVSVLFYMRTIRFSVGDTFSIPCFVHAKAYPIRFTVGPKRETIKVEAGTFTCLSVEPLLVGEGRGFTRRDKMTIWVTDDIYHMPVLIKAKAALGSLSARLLLYERE